MRLPVPPRGSSSLVALAFFVPPAPAVAEAPQAETARAVTLPLAEYEKLRRLREAASLTVVDRLKVTGSFASRTLSLALSGRSSGTWPAAVVLESVEGAALAGCDGSALVSRGEGAAYTLTPTGPRFEVRCRLVPSSGDRLSFVAGKAVLFPEGDVADGEFLPGADPGDRTRPFTVVRRIAASGEALAPTATGRYRVTLLPDETRFRWTIEVRNPNRGRAPFDLVLASGERVQEVVAPGPYDVKEGRTRFDLPPGDGTIVLTGTLSGTEFRAPVEAALSYLLLESHPLLKAEVPHPGPQGEPAGDGPPARVPGRAGVPPRQGRRPRLLLHPARGAPGDELRRELDDADPLRPGRRPRPRAEPLRARQPGRLGPRAPVRLPNRPTRRSGMRPSS